MTKLKKYVLLLIVSVGTSLAVYAAAIAPMLIVRSVDNVTSTTADFYVRCSNAEYLLVYEKSEFEDIYHLIDCLTVECGNTGREVVCTFSIGNMQPDTPYYILIEAVGFEDSETGDRERSYSRHFFRTLED